MDHLRKNSLTSVTDTKPSSPFQEITTSLEPSLSPKMMPPLASSLKKNYPFSHSNSMEFSKVTHEGILASTKKNQSVPSSPTIFRSSVSPTHSVTQLPLKSFSMDNHHDLGDTVQWNGDHSKKKGWSWVTCFCIVGFDLEVGPVLERVYPPINFSDEAKNVIRFTSFPDSNSNIMEEICFSFRFEDSTLSSSQAEATPTKKKKPSPLYFAYVFFRQKPDPSIRRGYFQKSVVLISHFAAHDLFMDVIRTLGPLILENEQVALESATEQIQQWPPPEKGQQQLPLLGTIVTCELLCHWKDTFPTQILTKPQNVPVLYPIFQLIIPKLWTLWEIMIVGDPIAIIAKCPSKCTEAVLGLLSLILPLSSALDYRTYITIQDPTSRTLFKNVHAPPKAIVAISNPYFFSTLRHWPHVLQLASSSKLSHVAPALKVEYRHGLTTKHRRIISRDKSVLDAVAKGICQGSTQLINQHLQKHFFELTERFLAPIQCFIDTLWPTSLTLLSPFPIFPQPFQRDLCLQFIKDRPVSIPIKSILSDWVQLYRSFLHSSTFSRWLEYTMITRARSWHQRYISIVCATDLKQWSVTQDRPSVHLILTRIVTIKDIPDPRTVLNEVEYKQLSHQESVLHSILDPTKA
ncbi:hypothetical protein HMI54_002034 [Coelomomyces lativittatus]|nr:hypothetical protein HMI56_001736 [Coelomomyces lativittatus]KAJ1509897.1 hypothetical protein HMI54_002034 [Coelomomyces lativittatus]KAJ1516704.1 hypothetical protein HMI55_001610 [Coelomomyces lativittatus]